MGIFKKKKIERNQQYLHMMNQWFILNQRHCTVADYLKKNQIHTVAVYGMGLYGRHLVRDLAGTEIKICYAIDKKKLPPYEGVPILQLKHDMPQVDAVINSVIFEHNAVEQQIRQYCPYTVLNLESIVFSSYEEVK